PRRGRNRHRNDFERQAAEAARQGAPAPRRLPAPGAAAEGTHLGCEHGIRGACTVMIDGRVARGCLTLAAQISSKTGIVARIPRRELKRLLSGHGRYIDDIALPRMLHACFVRSPHPHGKIASVDVAAARRAPGVSAVFTAADINPKCEPFVGVALHRPGHRSAPQRLLAEERAVWQGPPVAVVVAESRGEAEDAAELVAIEWEPLPAVGDQLQAIAPGAPAIHAELGDNIAFDFSLEKGAPAKAFADADIVIEEELRFERQM